MNDYDQEQYNKIKEIWKGIPTFKCKEGCSDCCGLIAMSRIEWEAFPEKLKGSDESMDCPYIKDHKCSVYDNRPTICRLFGATNNHFMKCPHGCKPEIILSDQVAKSILDDVDKIGE